MTEDANELSLLDDPMFENDDRDFPAFGRFKDVRLPQTYRMQTNKMTAQRITEFDSASLNTSPAASGFPATLDGLRDLRHSQ